MTRAFLHFLFHQLTLCCQSLCFKQQVFDCLRATVKPDTVMVLPALPFSPPPRNVSKVSLCHSVFDAVSYESMHANSTLNVPCDVLLTHTHTHLPSQFELDVFAKLTSCFNALGYLGGCPTLTVPVGQLRDGSPVAVTLLAVHK